MRRWRRCGRRAILRGTRRQRPDSSHVIGLVSRMSRLECVRETLRLALEALEPIEALARPQDWPLWWERYVDSKPDYKAKAGEVAGEDEHRDCAGALRRARGTRPAR